MDCGSHSRDIVGAVASNCGRFYIRVMSNAGLRGSIAQIADTEWTGAETYGQACQLASILFTAFFDKRGCRLVVQRTRRQDGQTGLFKGEFVHCCILTNDSESSERDVVEFYNRRASTDSTFDCMNNDLDRNPTSRSRSSLTTRCL